MKFSHFQYIFKSKPLWSLTNVPSRCPLCARKFFRMCTQNPHNFQLNCLCLLFQRPTSDRRQSVRARTTGKCYVRATTTNKRKKYSQNQAATDGTSDDDGGKTREKPMRVSFPPHKQTPTQTNRCKPVLLRRTVMVVSKGSPPPIVTRRCKSHATSVT